MLQTADILPLVLDVLRDASAGKGDAPSALAGYQVLDRLPPDTREPLIAERGMPGRGGGSFTAARLVTMALDQLERQGRAEAVYLDNQGIRFEVAGEWVSPGYAGVCKLYRFVTDGETSSGGAATAATPPDADEPEVPPGTGGVPADAEPAGSSEEVFRGSATFRAALDRYARVARGRGWPVGESKLALYRLARAAYAGGAGDGARAAHDAVQAALRGWWQVGRKGELLAAGEVYRLLGGCGACSRAGGLTLAGFGDRASQAAVLACLERLRGVKRLASGQYPLMAASKTLHFYNPRLFPIYDRAVVLGSVYRTFRRDWDAAYAGIAVEAADEGVRFYLAYLLWAARLFRAAYPGLMADFADWLVGAAADEGYEAGDLRGELAGHEATAFEFAMIGAAGAAELGGG